MRRKLLAVMIAASVLRAAPAQAQGWRWLEKLSGPGDFTGYEVSVKLWCQYDEVKGAADDPRLFVPGISMPCLFKDTRDPSRGSEVTVTTKENNPMRIDLARRHYALGVGASYLRGRNDLPYEPRDEHIDRTIQVLAFEGFFDHRLTDRTDVGVAFGPNLFLVPAFENFTRWSFEPRLTIKLFDLQREDPQTGEKSFYVGTASLRVGVLTFFGQFTASDFGAIGSYRSGTEIGPSVRFIFDFDRNPFKSK